MTKGREVGDEREKKTRGEKEPTLEACWKALRSQNKSRCPGNQVTSAGVARRSCPPGLTEIEIATANEPLA